MPNVDQKITKDGIPVWCGYDELLDPATLREWPDNPNQHPPEQIASLKMVIEANGWREAIVVSRRSGLITKGHGRRLAALAGDAWSEVPVEYQDYADEEKERQDVVADNAIAQKSKQDRESIAKFFAGMKINGQSVGLTPAEIKRVKASKYKEKEVEIPVQYLVLIDCENEAEQRKLLERFIEEKLKCRALIS